MGILRKIFGAPASREEWRTISLSLCKGLEDLRREWFDFSIRQIKKSLADAEETLIQLRHTKLKGNANFAIKAYQLLLVSTCIARQSYIARRDASDFTVLLYAQAWGTQAEQCMPFHGRYIEHADTAKEQLTLCTRDITEYITGMDVIALEELDVAGALSISGILHIGADLFVPHTVMVVAESFGDKRTARKYDQIISKISGRYDKMLK